MNDEVRAWVEAEVGAIGDVSRIGAGASRETWRVETGDGPLVVRIDTGTGPVAGTPLDLAREAVVYGALHDRGLPVPRLRAVEPEGRALLMDLAEGDAELGAVDDPARRREIGRDYLCWLGYLHGLDPASLDLPGWSRPANGPEHALLDLDLWSAICDDRAAGWTAPSTPFALGWLRTNAFPDIARTALCHGDAGPGNFLFDGSSVTALLDWEFAHLGDPHDDLAWVAVRNHLLGRPLVLGDALDGWCGVTGLDIEPARLEYYRVFVLTRMAISCDATIAWKHGLEDDSIRTQALLRPWLGKAVTDALGLAGCHDADLPPLRAQMEEALAASPHASLLALIPPLEPLEGP
ncbi:MAG: phosphotransferase family protein [Acidimicrobiales bacterium]